MMKQEFDQLVGLVTDPAAYEKIEFVYMNSQEFINKQAIADYYKKHDMNGIEKLYMEIIIEQTRKEEFKAFIVDLAVFAESYVDEIKNHLLKTAITTFKDKTIVKLLHEYRIRKTAETEQLARDMLFTLQHSDTQVSLSNNCLTQSAHFKTVLAGLLVDEWWHGVSKG